MIRLQRDRSPGAVKVGFRGQHRINRERELLRRRVNGEKPRKGVWKGAKDQLRIESGGKCAYCEGKAAHVAHGDVEHFRPKAVYWWLAYCYDNYVYSCQICNQSYKSANFPMGGTALTPPTLPANPSDADIDLLAGTLGPDPLDQTEVQQFQTLVAQEGAELPDPYAIDPEPLFRWRADPTLSEVEIEARGTSPGAQRAFVAARDFLGLNRDELKRWRWELYETAEVLGLAFQSGELSPQLHQRTEAKLRQMMSVEGEFAGMVRFLVRDILGLSL